MTKEGFDCLVGALTIARESGAFNGMKFFMNKEDQSVYGFSRADKEGCMMIDDWERYYKFDAAEDYDNPSEFVAECILEESMNRIELETEYDEVINQLASKYNF